MAKQRCRKKQKLKREKKLGMNFSTASNQLKRKLMFQLIQECNRDTCYRCKKPIKLVEEFSIDHKKDWLDSEDPKKLFWDLDNLAFSHKSCNFSAPFNNSKHYSTKRKNKKNNPFESRYWDGEKQIFVGSFATAEEAKEAAEKAKETAKKAKMAL